MSLGRRLFSPTPVIVLIAAFATYQTVMRSTTVLPIIAGTLLPLTTTLSPSDPLHTYTIAADGINATFIGYGATLTSLFVNDKNEVPRDVVVGFDDPARYIKDTETDHNYFGSVIGRYANRIKNGTFTIGTKTFHIPQNENDGRNTLHGGNSGYDARNWHLAQHNASSITYSLLDPSGSEGFPGTVVTYVTYTVTSPPRLSTRTVSFALDAYTPIMLSNHIYWNLGAFKSPNILHDTLQLPYANRIVSIDSIAVPTGNLQSVKYPSKSPPVPLNFTAPKQIGDGALYSQQCGLGCVGIDNAFILDRPYGSGVESMEQPQLIWKSLDTGITMTVRTNQQSFQLYSCNGMDGTIPIKSSQGNAKIEQYGCLVIEPQQWIAGINYPEWGQQDMQIFGPDTPPSVNWATYDFSQS